MEAISVKAEAICKDVAALVSQFNLIKAGADWVIEDVGSTNGTYVNGARIQRQALKKGDRVKIATLEFTVE